MTWLLIGVAATVTADDIHEIVLNSGLLVIGPLGVASYALRRQGHLRTLLRRSRDRVEAMIATTEADPWECDMLGNITYAGPGFAAHFGYELAEIKQFNLRELIHPLEYERLTEHVARGVGWQGERWRCLLSDGSEQWFMGSAVPLLGPRGQVVGYTGSAQPLGKSTEDEQRLTDLANEIYARLESLHILAVYQPIVSVGTGKLVGAESLSRFPGSDRSPQAWFTGAAEVGLQTRLELTAVEQCLAGATRLPDDIYVSVNVGPDTLVDPTLFDVLRAGPIPLHRLVLEITEHAAITDYVDVMRAVEGFRRAGIRIAVDDAGAGYASFRHIHRLKPEKIKLDRTLIAGLHEDPALRALATAVVSFGREMGSVVIAEGIEVMEELRSLQKIGIDSAQGYLFGRPTANWSTWNEWHQHGPLFRMTTSVPD
ncbi:MAG TPA: EAL domain-containing protein [Mycobacteriales bacterium]|nr:EAL domain-containing protein [Mycobacteriales bacterium]